jgi:spectinomycin phosphotransferase
VREPPAGLSDRALLDCLRTAYGVNVAELTFLPIGHDAWAGVYRAEADDGRAYFVKARRTVANRAGLLIPRFLQDHGVMGVVAPIPTLTGALWASAGAYAVLLYPFIVGGTGMRLGMSDEQWIEYGATLRQIHATTLSPEIEQVMRRETFRPDGADAARRVDAGLAALGESDVAGTSEPVPGDPPTQALAAIWRARRDEIMLLLARAEDLGRRLAQTAPPLVLCHADIHTNNVLLDAADQRIWIVDWDETMLAPRERDLMFVIGGGINGGQIGPREEALFVEGYGQSAATGRADENAVAFDPLALAYYRYAWAVSDIGAFGEEIAFRPDFSEATRQAAVSLFQLLFAPDYIVSQALGSETGEG